MTKEDDIIQLLVAAGRSYPADRLLADLRRDRAGVHLVAITGEGDLKANLNQGHWDAVVLFEDSSALKPGRVLELLKQAHCNVPLVVVLAEDSATDPGALLDDGAAEVLRYAEAQRLARALHKEVREHRLLRRARKLEHSLGELEKRHQALLDGAGDALSYIHEGMHRYCNPAYATFFGYPDTASVTTTPLLDLTAGDGRKELKRLLGAPVTEERTLTIEGKSKDGTVFPMDMTFTPVQFDGQPCLQLMVRRAAGNTAYARLVARLKNQDLLTHLHNAAYFTDALEQAIGAALRGETNSALLVARINGFAQLQSTLGRSHTNLILADIGKFLTGSINKPFTAARLGECEFGLLLHDGDLDEAVRLGDFIQGKINDQVTHAVSPSLGLSCSVGIAAINGHALDAGDALVRARGNLQERAGAASTEMLRIGAGAKPRTSEIIAYLEKALDHDSFRLLFQPVVNLKDEAAGGYKVLVRLLDGDGNEVSPAAFMTAANLGGLGERLDQWVVSRAIGLLGKNNDFAVKLILSLTSHSLASKTFLAWLSEKLGESHVPAHCLLFQISEIDLSRQPEMALAFARGLDELNAGKVISHFGCALNPFEHLETIAPHHVTLDETLLKGIDYNGEQRQAARTLVDGLHARGFLAGAPRVENMDVLPLLWEMGIDLVHGYCLQGPSREMNYEFAREQEITQADFRPR